VDVENIWVSDSGSDEDVERPHSAASVRDRSNLERKAEDIENIWVSDSGSDEDVERPHSAASVRDGSNIESKAGDIENIWVSDSGSDEEGAKSIVEDIRVSDGDGDGNGDVQLDSAISATVMDMDPEDVWVSASDTESNIQSSQPQSSQPTINSQLMVSPSRITYSRDSIALPNTFRQYGPQDFTYLQDHMFEEKLSDSEDSEE
jgi:hypothetical protein